MRQDGKYIHTESNRKIIDKYLDEQEENKRTFLNAKDAWLYYMEETGQEIGLLWFAMLFRKRNKTLKLTKEQAVINWLEKHNDTSIKSMKLWKKHQETEGFINAAYFVNILKRFNGKR